MKIGYLLASFFGSLFVSNSVLAQGLKSAGSNLSNIGKKSGVDTNADVGSVMGTVIAAALSLVGIIFLALMVYAGYLWMTARGEASQIEKAQEIIKSSLIGIAVVLGAYAITAFVTGKLGSL
jgi:hypothetical protein